MTSSLLYWSRRGLALAALGLLFGVSPGVAQTGSIEGTVRNARTEQRLEGARVTVQGTNLTATTNDNGYYRIDNVPVGTYTVRAQVIGYNALQARNARVTAGIPLTVDFDLLPAVINLDAMVVTGVLGETQTAKLPFTVDMVATEEMPVVQSNAASALQGKIAGAQVVSGSGRPGGAPTILLRGATSIDAQGRSQEPLFVVDGVILGESMVDLDALDIESIEVVKGAAAASLYGSRAASGVVQIKTRRGSSLLGEMVQFTARSEFGANQLPGKFDSPLHHQYEMTEDGSQFVDPDGNPCDWFECSQLVLAGQKAEAGEAPDAWNTYMTEAWPGTTYDQVDRFFDPGTYQQHYFSAQGRAGGTNFHASYSHTNEEGVMPGKEGFGRNNFRVNVDQTLGETFQIGASAFYSRSKQDDFSTGVLFDLTRMPANVDLRRLNECPAEGPCEPWQEPRLLPDGTQDSKDVWLNPDPFNEESPNPLYQMLNIDDFWYRGRFLGSTNIQFRPLSWISVDANVSYDRLDARNEYYRFKGYKTISPSTSTNEGGMTRRHEVTEAFNASANVTFTQSFGDLDTRTQVRYLTEWEDEEYTVAGGSRFAVGDVPTLQTLDLDYVTANSGLEAIRSDGYFGITSLVFKDRYILDALVRNDGSSLFGPDERRQWYYRLAGAWRVREDFAIPGMDEFKLRLAYGTAGGRPRFTAQYETYSVSGGKVRPVTLGNRELKPELSKELEAGVDLLAFGRLGVTVNYAKNITEDQILQVPLQAYAGFANQWRNAGTLKSETWEATLDYQLVQTRDFSWSMRLLGDFTRQEITELNVPAFTYGVSGQGMGGVFYAREGEALGQFYGMNYATSCDHLLGGAPCSEFEVNDDDLLVWVGEGGSLDNPQWGESRDTPFGFKGTNQTLQWGTPFFGWGLDRATGDTTFFLPAGKTYPDYSVSFSSTIQFHGISLYGLIESVQGIDVYNQPQQWAIFRNYGGIQDQTGVPENQQKPLGYYGSLYGVAGLAPVNYFMQDASFTKLREVSLRYRFDRDQLAATPFRFLEGLAINLIGRNLITWSSYNGYDPEVGRGGGNTGSAAIARVDGYQYPNFRTFTGAIEINF